jgi:hypothetical protein
MRRNALSLILMVALLICSFGFVAEGAVTYEFSAWPEAGGSRYAFTYTSSDFIPILGQTLLRSDLDSLIEPINSSIWQIGFVKETSWDIIRVYYHPSGDVTGIYYVQSIFKDGSFRNIGEYDQTGIIGELNQPGHLSVREASVPVPEPSAILLLGSGLFGLVGYGKKRFKK